MIGQADAVLRLRWLPFFTPVRAYEPEGDQPAERGGEEVVEERRAAGPRAALSHEPLPAYNSSGVLHTRHR